MVHVVSSVGLNAARTFLERPYSCAQVLTAATIFGAVVAKQTVISNTKVYQDGERPCTPCDKVPGFLWDQYDLMDRENPNWPVCETTEESMKVRLTHWVMDCQSNRKAFLQRLFSNGDSFSSKPLLLAGPELMLGSLPLSVMLAAQYWRDGPVGVAVTPIFTVFWTPLLFAWGALTTARSMVDMTATTAYTAVSEAFTTLHILYYAAKIKCSELSQFIENKKTGRQPHSNLES